MSALQKEKIFEELRNYHMEKFPVKIKNDQVNNLRIEFGILEDKIISMTLSLVYGRSLFVDSTKELNSFQNKLNTTLPSQGEESNRNMFTSKIGHLGKIILMAKESTFNFKPAIVTVG